MAQQPNVERIVRLQAQRAAAQIADLTTEVAMLQEALERANARIAELEAPDEQPAAERPAAGKSAAA